VFLPIMKRSLAGGTRNQRNLLRLTS